MALNTFQTEKAVSHLFVKELYVFRVDQVGALELEKKTVRHILDAQDTLS